MDYLSVALGAVPGTIALVGSAIWMGKLSNRMDTVEREVADLKDIKASVATIAERTLNTADMVKGQAGDIRRVTDHLLDEGRTFAREIVRRDRAHSGG